MKPARTLSEARALAAVRTQHERRRENVDPAHAKALAHWRRPTVLTRWLAQRARAA